MKTIKTLFKNILLVCLIGSSSISLAQNRLILNNDVFVIIENAANLVIENSANNAISTQGTGGNIVTEAEDNLVKWIIGAGTGNYTIPFTTKNNAKIPMTISISSAGVGSGHFLISTITDSDNTNSWNNSDYLPSTVSAFTGTDGSNNSDKVIDRFWRIEQSSYSTQPIATINFTYDENELSSSGNSILTGSLLAQYYNTTQNEWIIPGSGTDNYPTTTVTGANFPADEFHPIWTLSDVSNPLPVELVDFDAIQNNDFVELSWSTSSERNNDYFTVLKTVNFNHWEEVGVVPGAGNSNDLLTYKLTDLHPFNGMAFYQLKQTDYDGNFSYSEIRKVNFSYPSIGKIYPNPAFNEITLNYQKNELNYLSITTAYGTDVTRHVIRKDVNESKLTLDISSLKPGIYYVNTSYKKYKVIKL